MYLRPLTHARGDANTMLIAWASGYTTMPQTTSNYIHHQIDQAFPIFLAYIEKHGKAWIRGYQFSPLRMMVDYTKRTTPIIIGTLADAEDVPTLI